MLYKIMVIYWQNKLFTLDERELQMFQVYRFRSEGSESRTSFPNGPCGVFAVVLGSTATFVSSH